MTDIEFIKRFSKITVTESCKEAGVNPSNVYAGRAKPEVVEKVRKILQLKIAQLTVDGFFDEQQEDRSIQS